MHCTLVTGMSCAQCPMYMSKGESYGYTSMHMTLCAYMLHVPEDYAYACSISYSTQWETIHY